MFRHFDAVILRAKGPKDLYLVMRTFIIIFALFFLPFTALAQLPEELRGVKLTNVDSQVLFSDEAIAEAMA